MRRRRSAKIVATLGPASSTPEQHPRTVRRRRRRVPAQFQPRHARRSPRPLRGHPRRSSRRPAGRSAFSPTCRGRSCASAISPRARSSSRPAPTSASISIDGPATQAARRCRIPRSSRRSSRGPNCCSTTARCGSRPRMCAGLRRDQVPRRRHLSDRKGVNVPNAVLPLSAITEKDRADLAFALDHGADWIALSLRPAPRRRRRGPQARRRPRRGHGQARKAVGDPTARRDHRAGGRADGGARRSRRRDAARGRADACRSRWSMPAGSPASRSSSRRRCSNR